MGLFKWVSDFVSAWQGDGDGNQTANAASKPQTPSNVVAVVRKRRGSMLVDEDGDVAHEFYEEDEEGKLVPVSRGLRPQGMVKVDPPHLSKDSPVLMVPAKDFASSSAAASAAGTPQRRPAGAR